MGGRSFKYSNRRRRMRRIFVLVLATAVAAIFLSGCGNSSSKKGDVASGLFGHLSAINTDSIVNRSTETKAPETKAKKKPSYGKDTSGDEHYIQPDDFFISNEDLKSRAWMHVQLAKMITSPTAQTKSEAEFMKVHDGKQLWTKYYWSSRIATGADLKLGTLVIMLDDTDGEGLYSPPEDKNQARNKSWFIAKITDTSDLFKGYVMVSGGYKVRVEAMRIPIKKF